jgi:AraC family transcriptional regulator, arabinose operon regulatory protein
MNKKNGVLFFCFCIMVKEIRYYTIPPSQMAEQRINQVTQGLYLVETGEFEVVDGTVWECRGKEEIFLLVFCVRGAGLVLLAGGKVPIANDQYFIVPPEEGFKFYPVGMNRNRFLVAGFGGKTARHLAREFSIVRNLVPSINNMVANREMLFEEIFNNLSKGFHNQNREYVNLCFGHLLATFVYANRTSDDLADESSPVVRRAVSFLERNVYRRLSLKQVANEAGYSPTYLSALFRKETNYAPLSYFSHLKILKACEFLDYTPMKVKEISYRLGYTDPYYFTRDFKKKVGMSPRQYRNRIRQ